MVVRDVQGSTLAGRGASFMWESGPSLVRRGAAKLFRWQSRITQKLFLPLAHEPVPDRWVFVVGCYNSGTSLLAQILAQHPSIGGLPDEGVFFTDSLPYPEQFGWSRMWIRCLDQVRLDPEDGSKVPRIKKQWSLVFPKGVPNLLEKSVANTARMPFLQAHFRPAYFVAIIRNGYAVAEGIRRRVRPANWKNPEFRDQYPIELCAEQWRGCDDLISRDRENVDRFLQVSYEDLTSNPAQVMKQVTGFLGLPPLDTEVFERSWFVRDKNEPISNMNSRSLERLTEEDLVAVEKVAGDCLTKYGYSRNSP